MHKTQARKEISVKDKHQQLENSESDLKPLEERLAVTKANIKGLKTTPADIVKKSQAEL